MLGLLWLIVTSCPFLPLKNLDWIGDRYRKIMTKSSSKHRSMHIQCWTRAIMFGSWICRRTERERENTRCKDKWLSYWWTRWDSYHNDEQLISLRPFLFFASLFIFFSIPSQFCFKTAYKNWEFVQRSAPVSLLTPELQKYLYFGVSESI